jgi:hypothetical protein
MYPEILMKSWTPAGGAPDLTVAHRGLFAATRPADQNILKDLLKKAGFKVAEPIAICARVRWSYNLMQL